jgi:hypothetical protein
MRGDERLVRRHRLGSLPNQYPEAVQLAANRFGRY